MKALSLYYLLRAPWEVQQISDPYCAVHTLLRGIPGPAFVLHMVRSSRIGAMAVRLKAYILCRVFFFFSDFSDYKCNGDGCLVTKLRPTLSTPWTVACQAPLSTGFPRQGYWSGLPFPPPGNIPDPGTEPRTPALQEDSFTSELPRKP